MFKRQTIVNNPIKSRGYAMFYILFCLKKHRPFTEWKTGQLKKQKHLQKFRRCFLYLSCIVDFLFLVFYVTKVDITVVCVLSSDF